jgi:hypothetical protein
MGYSHKEKAMSKTKAEQQKAYLLENLEALDIEIKRLTQVLLATEEGTEECDMARAELNNHRGMCRDILFDLRFL